MRNELISPRYSSESNSPAPPRRITAEVNNFSATENNHDWDYCIDKPAHILVVEDDDVDRERLSRYIKKSTLPIKISHAINGADAIKKISSLNIDVILLDYHLGDMTGIKLLEQVWKDHHDDIHIVMITGMGSEKTATEAIRLGVYDYITKRDINSHSLTSILTSALQASQLKHRLHKSQEQLKQLSFYDTLTGLPNRNLFFDRLQQTMLAAERNQSRFSVLMIDLNLFKEINDNFGHQAGDQVLHEVGRRLNKVARKSDTFARLGGDEFACLLHNIQDDESAVGCAEKITESLIEPLTIYGRIVQIGASIGIAHYPDHGQDHTTLLSNADNAMYQAKREHLKYEIFQPNSGTRPAKVSVTKYLHQGIRNGEMFLEYQPKIQFNNNTLIGAEVLVRWDSPQFGIIMPGDFITFAERSSLIEELTYLTLEMAMNQLQQWQSSSHINSLSINLTARMLGDDSLLTWLKQAVIQHGISSGMLTLEITETALAASSSCAQNMLGDLVMSGFKISIDDFGSGFTSFKSIRDVEISELKIDQIFINKIHLQSRDAAIVHSILQLTQSLGIPAVAEGVENMQQQRCLQQLGCNIGQGFGIAEPMHAALFQQWCEHNKP